MLKAGLIVIDEVKGRLYKVVGTEVIRTIYGQALWVVLEDCMGKEVRLPANSLKPYIE